jgi:hypothetical protein
MFDGDALAWDFSGMDPDEIFVALLEGCQAPPPLHDGFASPAQFLDPSSSSLGATN